MRRLDVGRERLRRRLERRGVASVVLGTVVLTPATVSAEMVRRTVEVIHTTPSAVAALLAAPIPLRPVLAGLCLALAAGGGLGWSWPAAQRPDPPAVQVKPVEPPEPSSGFDADGQALPPGAVARLGSRKFRTEGHNQFILPTPDGKYILVQPQPSLSASPARGLILIDAETGLRVREFEDGPEVPKMANEPVRPVAFSPDGTKLYGIATGKHDRERFDQWAQFHMHADRVLLIWEVSTGKRVAKWNLPPGYEGPRSGNDFPGSSLLGVTVSVDGKRLLVSGAVRMIVKPDRTIDGVAGFHVLDAETGAKIATRETSGLPVGLLADGKEVLTFRRESTVTAYDLATGAAARTYAFDGPVLHAAVSPDGKRVAAVGRTGPDRETGEIRIWDAATAKELHRIPGPRSWSAHLLFSADSATLFLGSGTGRIQRWSVADGKELSGWDAHSGIVADLFHRPGTNELVSVGSYDGRLRRWDAATGKPLSRTTAYVGEVATVRTPDAKGLVAVDETGRLEEWNLATGKVKRTLQTPGQKYHIPVFTPDGKHLLLAAQAGPNTVWSWPEGRQVGTFEPPLAKDPKAEDHYWGTLRFSPDGTRLFASRFGRGSWVWTWPEKKLLWHEAGVPESSLVADDRTLVTTAWHESIAYRDLATGNVRKEVKDVNAPGVGDGTLDLAYTRDGRRLLSGHFDKTFRVRDAATGAILKTVSCTGYVWSFAISPSGWLAAVAVDNHVRVFDTTTWDEVARFDGHDGTIRHVHYGSDDWTVVSTSGEDGTALVWSLKPVVTGMPEAKLFWADLAGDGPAVRRAVGAAAAHPAEAIRLFREKWPIPKPVDAERVRRLIDDLDAATFPDREAASAELAAIGPRVEAEVKKAATESKSKEVQKRAATLLAGWAASTLAADRPEDAIARRAVWALEIAHTPQAKAMLKEWADAKLGNRMGEEAAAALRRWK
jgi:WD40 repeat protein